MVRRTLAVGILMPIVAATDAAAQTAADYRRQLDSLEPARLRARAAMRAQEREAEREGGVVAISRGNLRIIADSTIASHLLEAADSAARAIDATFGASAQLLAEHPVIARERRVMHNGDTVTRIGIEANGQEHVVALDSRSDTRRQVIAALTGRAAAVPLYTSLDDSLRGWLRAPLPAALESRTERTTAYAEVVTASTDISRRCMAGDLLGCRELLGLSPIADPLATGFTSAQRRALVAAHASQLRRYETARSFDRCVHQGDDAACTERLRELSTETILRSISSASLRRSFARAALRRGGPGAYQRLRESYSLPLDARFAIAARTPADSLVMAWRADVLASRPSPASVTPATGLATLAWIAACGALALRSSRWR